MRILLATVKVPFIHGGAEELASGLMAALKSAGHEADLIAMPFRFFPANEVERSVDVWSREHLDNINNYEVDRLIGLKFPAYTASHVNKVLWVLHQHRDVYDLGDENKRRSADWKQMEKKVRAADQNAFSSSKKIYTISQTVADRIIHYNDHHAECLYHPPPNWRDFYCADSLPYIFMPSRFEELKRQELLIHAARMLKSPVKVVFAGIGGQLPRLQRLVEELRLNDRIAFLGQISHDEKVCWYARALGVFFGPHNEDYGYVTLESMLSAKPVITCKDSGGPTEFVRDGETGFVCDTEPEAIAAAIERLYANRKQADTLGRNGLDHYRGMHISWDHVVERLIA